MKLCVNCLYHRDQRILAGTLDMVIKGDYCIKLADPVTGGVQVGCWSSCDLHRSHDFVESILNGTCGKRGRWWKPKL